MSKKSTNNNGGGCSAYVGMYVVLIPVSGILALLSDCDMGAFLFGTFVAPAIMTIILLPFFRYLGRSSK